MHKLWKQVLEISQTPHSEDFTRHVFLVVTSGYPHLISSKRRNNVIESHTMDRTRSAIKKLLVLFEADEGPLAIQPEEGTTPPAVAPYKISVRNKKKSQACTRW